MRLSWILLTLMAAAGAADETTEAAKVPAATAEAAKPGAKPGAKPAAAPAAERFDLHAGLQQGARYIGSNTVAFDLRNSVRTGNKETVTRESIERTERFRDHVKIYSERGPLEIERQYQRLFTKIRTDDVARPDVDQSPLQGTTVIISENRRRRSIRSTSGINIPSFVRKTVGMEMDWRDVLPREPVAIGDKWEGDAEAVARRMAPYLDSGSRSRMVLRFEGIDVVGERRIARLYIDWTIEGMRDKQLYTKAGLAGDARFDLDLQRFVLIDIAGSFVVRGAIIGANGNAEIIQSEGRVSLKSTIQEESVAAAAAPEGATPDASKPGANSGDK